MPRRFPLMFAFLLARRGDAVSLMSSVPCPSDREAAESKEAAESRAESGRAIAARWFLSVVSKLLAHVPLRVGHFIANGLAWPHYVCFPARRRGVLANLAVLRPGQSPREHRVAARRVMAAYNKMLFEFFRLPRMKREDIDACVDIEGMEHVTGALARGRGLILTSCHIGNWELGAVIVAMRGLRLHAVAGVQLGRWLTGAVRDAKDELAVSTVAPEDSYRKLFRALSKNDVVALMVDGDIFSNGQPVGFFGRETSWPSGPGVLAKRTHAPVVCGYCARTERGTFRIVLEPALDPDTFPSAEALNVAIARTSERHIAAHVEQWCIFRPFFESNADIVAPRRVHRAAS